MSCAPFYGCRLMWEPCGGAPRTGQPGPQPFLQQLSLDQSREQLGFYSKMIKTAWGLFPPT